MKTDKTKIDFSKLDKPYLIAEIGINHNADLQIAKKLIDAAFACSWDCVKFQKKNPDLSVPEHQKNQPKETPWGQMTYLEYKHRMELGKKEYDLVDKYCRLKPIHWTVSVWDLDSLEFMKQYQLPFLKIPSALLTHVDLLKKSAQTGLPIVLSTGMSTIKEIDAAVKILDKYASQYVLMHCNSSYPSKLSELNLSFIPKLQKRYGCVVGYSGQVWTNYAARSILFLICLVTARKRFTKASYPSGKNYEAIKNNKKMRLERI